MQHNRKIIYFAGFLFFIPIALTSYLNSSLLDIYVDKYSIGIIYIIASIVTIWGLVQMPKILKRFGNRNTAVIFSLLIFLSFLLMALGNTKLIIIGAFIVNFLAIIVVGASLDIFVEDFSQNSKIGRFRGFYLSVTNGAWILAQIISSSIIGQGSFKTIYLLSAFLMILTTFVFILFLRNFKDPEYKKISTQKTVKIFWRNKHLSKIYFLNFILQFFYAWMIIYMPIYLNQSLGFSWSQIGVIFSIMLLPFVILSFPLGKISDKVGEKKMLLYAFLIITFFTLIIPLITERAIWLWALILFGTRIGAAAISVLSDSYFFKIVTEEESEAISFYRNTYPLSYVIAPLLAIPILYFLPSYEYLFFVLGAIMLVGFFVTLRLKDVR